MNKQEQIEWTVCVRCLTYNHAPYIIDTMDGFCMQETNFPYVCNIIDDASTDGEPEVIMNYLSNNFDLKNDKVVRKKETDDYIFVYARHKSNINCFFAVYFLKYNHFRKKSKKPYFSEWHNKSKYIAFCEGDDYWIDCMKLKKQVDILDEDKAIMMVYTSFKTVDESGRDKDIPFFKKCIDFSRSGNLFGRLLWKNFIMTLTACYRKEVLESSILINAPRSLDYLLFLSAASMGKIAFIKEETGCYRVTSTGAIATSIKRVNGVIDSIFRYFVYLYCNGKIPLKMSLKEKAVVNCVILVRVFEKKRIALAIMKKKKSMILVFPYVLFVKIAQSICYRYFFHYYPFKFYDFVFGKK